MARENPFSKLDMASIASNQTPTKPGYGMTGAAKTVVRSIEDLAENTKKLMEGEVIVDLVGQLARDSRRCVSHRRSLLSACRMRPCTAKHTRQYSTLSVWKRWAMKYRLSMELLTRFLYQRHCRNSEPADNRAQSLHYPWRAASRYSG